MLLPYDLLSMMQADQVDDNYRGYSHDELISVILLLNRKIERLEEDMHDTLYGGEED